MAKAKPDKKKKMKKAKPTETPEQLYEQAISCLERSEPEDALNCAQRLLALVQPSDTPTPTSLPALNLLGEINIELGDVDAARRYFMLAVTADPDGAIPEALGGGSEKFLWLAQLSEEGGADSVKWFEKGVGVLKREISDLESSGKEDDEDVEAGLEEKRRKVANALCGVVEVYMTDLSYVLNMEVVRLRLTCADGKRMPRRAAKR